MNTMKTAQIGPPREVTDRVLGILDSSLVSRNDIPTSTVTNFFYDAEWYDVVAALDAGRIVVFEAEPAEVSGVLMAAQYETARRLVSGYDSKRKRLWLAHAETRPVGNGRGNGARTRKANGRR